MKLGLVGYGKMGQAIASLAPKFGHTISSTTTSKTALDVSNTDLFIDFSRPDAVLKNANALIGHGKSIVIGTTGWDVNQLKNQKEVGILFASNFSLGIHLFSFLIKTAAAKLKAYSPALIEEHHNQKLDAPSGTAKELLQHLPDHTSVSSLRCGSIIGNHEIIFDGPFDQIRLRHEAKSREAFAFGAIKAAEWLHGKKGFFTIEDMLHDQL